MNCVFVHIPDIAFHRAVQQYGFAMGKPVFTWRQQQDALKNYTFFAIYNN